MISRELVASVDAGQIYRIGTSTYEFEPWAGSHISKACQSAAEWSKANWHDVSFQFNDIKITANPTLSGEALEASWRTETERRAKAYRESPEGIAARERDKAEIQRCQEETDAVIAELPGVLDDVPALLKCLCRLSTSADRTGVCWDSEAVASLLETKWVNNDCVGMQPETIQADKSLQERWIIGQAINCLRHGMGPHHMIHKFVEGYFQAENSNAN